MMNNKSIGHNETFFGNKEADITISAGNNTKISDTSRDFRE
jgi:hypothetical protein